jgi:cell division protein ZapA
MAEDNQSIRVEIYDQGYNLRGTDPEYIEKLADMVDARMRAISQHSSTVDSVRVAVLAALNLADEYCQLQHRYDGVSGDYDSRAEHLGSALETAMEEVLAERRCG